MQSLGPAHASICIVVADIKEAAHCRNDGRYAPFPDQSVGTIVEPGAIQTVPVERMRGGFLCETVPCDQNRLLQRRHRYDRPDGLLGVGPAYPAQQGATTKRRQEGPAYSQARSRVHRITCRFPSMVKIPSSAPILLSAAYPTRRYPPTHRRSSRWNPSRARCGDRKRSSCRGSR